MDDKEWSEFKGKFPKLCATLANAEEVPAQLYREFERIVNRLEENWGTYQACDYFDELLLTQRSGRRGFKPEVAQDLMRLNRLHMALCPEYYRNPHDPFSQFR